MGAVTAEKLIKLSVPDVLEPTLAGAGIPPSLVIVPVTLDGNALSERV
jgi:hypothetical protein